MLASFLMDMRKRELQVYASGTSFFFLMSIVPMLVLAGAMLPRLGIDQNIVINIASTIMPDAIVSFTQSMIIEAYSLSNTLLPITVIFLVYSCSGGMMGLMFGLNRVYDVNKDMSYIRIRTLAMIYTLMLMGLITILLSFVIGGDGYLHAHIQTTSAFWLKVIYNLRYLIVFVAGVLILTLMYKLIPRENQPLIEQAPGAIFTMSTWILFTKIFSMFVTGDRYATIFGRFAVLIIAMMWLYWCIYIILIGGYINWYFRYFFRQGLRQLEEKRESRK